MQLLFQTGSEFKETPGLRILDGTVEKLEIQKNGEGKEKLPHIGWRTIDFAKDKSPIFLRNNFFYFNHLTLLDLKKHRAFLLRASMVAMFSVQ